MHAYLDWTSVFTLIQKTPTLKRAGTHLELGGQRGFSGLKNLVPVGLEPVTFSTAAEHLNHSTTGPHWPLRSFNNEWSGLATDACLRYDRLKLPSSQHQNAMVLPYGSCLFPYNICSPHWDAQVSFVEVVFPPSGNSVLVISSFSITFYDSAFFIFSLQLCYRLLFFCLHGSFTFP